MYVWIYNNTAAIIRQGSRKSPSPSNSTPDGHPLATKLNYLDLPKNMPGPGAHCRVSVARCKPCTNPHHTTDLPRYLPAGLAHTQYVLNNYTK